MKLLDDVLGAFRAYIPIGQFGAQTLLFREIKACRATQFFEKKDPITRRWWILDIDNDQQTCFFPKGLKVGFMSCLLRDRARNWWGEISHTLRVEAVRAMTQTNFVTRFMADFAPAIEVQQMSREIQYLHQTTETMPEITANFRERALMVLQYVAYEEIDDEVS